MLSLPSLTPQDSYTLWYTSSTAHPPLVPESSQNPADHLNTPQPHSHARRHNATTRTPLARLRMDEEYIALRKSHITAYGSTWLKPPGIPKSLHQLHEEEREAKEHQEALRREQLAQELAEAEGGDELLQGEGADAEEEGMRDLDDEVPDADISRDMDNDDDDDEDEDENEEDEVDNAFGTTLAQRLPARETLVEAGTSFEEEGEEEDNSQMLQEEDLYREIRQGVVNTDIDMVGGVDLDDEIPDAEEGGYEHTDTEEEISSSEEEEDEEEEEEEERVSQAPRDARFASSMVRSDGTQNSLDLSSILEENSPQRRRR